MSSRHGFFGWRPSWAPSVRNLTFPEPFSPLFSILLRSFGSPFHRRGGEAHLITPRLLFDQFLVPARKITTTLLRKNTFSEVSSVFRSGVSLI
jgi:hypothetical protein